MAETQELKLGLTATYLTAADLNRCTRHREPLGASTGKCMSCVLDRAHGTVSASAEEGVA